MKKLILIAVLIGSVLMGSMALAHSGRTDKNGCHIDRKTGIRHCH